MFKWREKRVDLNDEEDWPRIGERRAERATTDLGTGVRDHQVISSDDYPKLGEKCRKRRDESSATCCYASSTPISGRMTGWHQRSRPRRSDPIRIKLKEALQGQLKRVGPPSKTSAMPYVKRENQASGAAQRQVRSLKRLTALKRRIIYSRRIKREELLDIPMGRLKIGDSHQGPPADHVLGMSRLNIFGTDYRSPRGEDNPAGRLGLTLLAAESSSGNPNEPPGHGNISGHLMQLDIVRGALSMNINEANRIRYSKKFREYCTNLASKPLNESLEMFLAEMVRLQRKLHSRDSAKGKQSSISRRRYYVGLKELDRHVQLKKVKLAVIAPDLERTGSVEGGLEDTVDSLLSKCNRQEVPYCFGLCRRKLGYLLCGRGFVSCVGIVNYHGAEEQLKSTLTNVMEARNEFLKLTGQPNRIVDVQALSIDNLLTSEVIAALLKALAFTNTNEIFST